MLVKCLCNKKWKASNENHFKKKVININHSLITQKGPQNKQTHIHTHTHNKYKKITFAYNKFLSTTIHFFFLSGCCCYCRMVGWLLLQQRYVDIYLLAAV